jgi:hypothetical protein
VNDRWLEEVEEVKNHILGYFENNFKARKWDRPTIDNIWLPKLLESSKLELENPFTMEEVTSMMMECDGDPLWLQFWFLEIFLEYGEV